jgi:hypothetical protein
MLSACAYGHETKDRQCPRLPFGPTGDVAPRTDVLRRRGQIACPGDLRTAESRQALSHRVLHPDFSGVSSGVWGLSGKKESLGPIAGVRPA